MFVVDSSCDYDGTLLIVIVVGDAPFPLLWCVMNAQFRVDEVRSFSPL